MPSRTISAVFSNSINGMVTGDGGTVTERFDVTDDQALTDGGDVTDGGMVTTMGSHAYVHQIPGPILLFMIMLFFLLITNLCA